MQHSNLIEKKPHGTLGFPFEYYFVDQSHPRYIMNYHWHAEFELIRILSGTLTVTLNEKTFEVSEGELVFVHGGVLHAGAPKNCVYECLVFDLKSFLRHTQDSADYIQKILDGLVVVYHHFSPRYTQVHMLMSGVFSAMHRQDAGFELTVIGDLYRFFGLVYREHLYLDSKPKTSRKDQRRTSQLRNVIEYIDTHLSSQISLEQLAEAACMSPKYFCRFFSQMTHYTPIEYLNMQRIEQACYALTRTDEPVTVIAMNCGFNDLSYFIKTFKRYKGVTPGQYRK